MFVYLVMLAASVILGVILCGKRYGKVGKAIYCVVGAIAFIVISSIRFRVGYDFNSYGQMFANFQYQDLTDIMLSRTEKGYTFPLYILSLIFEDYYTVYIYTSIIIYSAVFWLIYKHSSMPWISVTAFLCLGVYFNSLCFLRQFIAGIIVAYALKFVSEKKSLYFFVLTFAAATFHWSALMMLGVYFLIRIKPGYIYLGISTAGTVLACVLSNSIMNWAVSNIYVYRSYDITRSVEASTGLSPRYTIMFGIVFLAAFLFRERLMKKNPANSLYINLLMFTVIFEALGMRHAILSRFAIITYLAPVLYLTPDLVTVAREFIQEFSRDKNKQFLANVGTASVASVFGIGMYLILMSVNYNGVMPYSTIAERNKVFEKPPMEEAVDTEDTEQTTEAALAEDSGTSAASSEQTEIGGGTAETSVPEIPGSEQPETEETMDEEELEQNILDAIGALG